MYKHDLKLQISQTQVITTLVLCLFLLSVNLLPKIKFFPDLGQDNSQQEVFSVDMELTAQLQENKNHSQNTDAAYAVKDPDLLMLKLKSAKYLSATNFDSFLKKIENMRKLENNSNNIKTAENTVSLPTKKQYSSINYNALIAKKSVDEKLVDHKDLKKVISKNYSAFQKCYESTLIKDELLSGNASIILNIGSKANVRFKGVGQAKYKKELESCLSNTALKINFPSQYRGNKVKFSLFFNS